MNYRFNYAYFNLLSFKFEYNCATKIMKYCKIQSILLNSDIKNNTYLRIIQSVLVNIYEQFYIR